MCEVLYNGVVPPHEFRFQDTEVVYLDKSVSTVGFEERESKETAPRLLETSYTSRVTQVE